VAENIARLLSRLTACSAHLLVTSLVGWLQHEQHQVIQYLREENRLLKAHAYATSERFTDDERRCLAALGARLSVGGFSRRWRRSSRPTPFFAGTGS
jgi:hypothetical protein